MISSSANALSHPALKVLNDTLLSCPALKVFNICYEVFD